MQYEVPTRWVEEAESRRVLREILSERMPAQPGCVVAEDAAAHLPTRLLGWLATHYPMSWPMEWPVSLPRLH